MADRSAELQPPRIAKESRPRTILTRSVRETRSPAELHELVQRALETDDVHAQDDATRNVCVAVPTLGLLADSPHWRVVQGAATSTRSTSEILDRIIGVHGDIAHPEHRDNEEWRWVLHRTATHTALRPTSRRHLATLGDGLIDAAVASRTDLSDGELTDFARRGAGARIWVAFHLFRDPLRLVDVAERLRNDRNDTVVDTAYGTFPDAGLLEAWEYRRFLGGLIDRDNVPGERVPLPEPFSPLTNRTLRIDRGTPDPRVAMELALEIMASDDRIAARLFASRYTATADELDLLADFPDRFVVEGVVENLRTSQKTMQRVLGSAGDIARPELRDSGGWIDIIRAASLHPRLDAISRRGFAASKDFHTRVHTASRRDLSDGELEAFAQDGRPLVRAQVAYRLSQDPNRLPDVLTTLASEAASIVPDAATGIRPDLGATRSGDAPPFN